MDQPGGTNPLHDPRWTAIGSAIASLFAGAFVVWRELRGRMREGRRQRTEEAAKRADETWDQASELRAEQQRRIDRLEERDATKDAKIIELEHSNGNLKMKLAAMTIRYNAIVRDLQARPGDEWNHLREYPEPNGGGTKEVQKP